MPDKNYDDPDEVDEAGDDTQGDPGTIGTSYESKGNQPPFREVREDDPGEIGTSDEE
jgi:hypothetical protein